MTGKKCFHDVVSDSWRKKFSWRELYFITDQTIGLMTKGVNSWRRVQNFMTENNGFHAVIEWFMTENYFMTGVWFHDGKKKSMTGNKGVSWRILNFMTQKTFSWRKIHDFMLPKNFHDGKKVDFRDGLCCTIALISVASARWVAVRPLGKYRHNLSLFGLLDGAVMRRLGEGGERPRQLKPPPCSLVPWNFIALWRSTRAFYAKW